jgi:D-3-phosphoglycerate dehydrogenase
VANCPGKNAAAVAELAFGLILAADRQIPNVARDMRQGQWRKKHYSAAQGLHGRTLGLLGLGNAGQAMIPRAQAFGMKVVAWSRSLTPARAQALGVTQAADPLEVARHSDVVSVHVALAPETRGLVGRAFLEAMRPGATLINTSRGGVVDEDSLLWAVQHRALRCGVDVWSGEPKEAWPPPGSPLLEQEQVYGTCHIAASTAQAQQAVADQAVAIALTWRDTGVVPCCVNLSRRSRATHLLVVRHLDRVGVLAGVLDLLRRDQVNVQEMDNVIFDGGKAAVARIRLDQAPSPGALSQMDQAADILALDLLPLTLGEA